MALDDARARENDRVDIVRRPSSARENERTMGRREREVRFEEASDERRTVGRAAAVRASSKCVGEDDELRVLLVR